MNIKKFDIIDANMKAMNSDPRNGGRYNNLDIYIPRIDSRYTEDEIQFTFRAFGVGIVELVDFVATKDPETKEIKYFSAFLRLFEWNMQNLNSIEFKQKKTTKLWISESEFWIMLPAKSPLSRSKVNTHQLAAYTDEVFIKVESIEQNITNTLLVKIAEQSEQIKIQQAMFEQQAIVNSDLSEKVEFLMESVEFLTTILQSTTKKDIKKEEKSQVIQQQPQKFTFDQEIVNKIDVSFADKKLKNQESKYYKDECFFLTPLNSEKKKESITSGTILFNMEDMISPLAKSLGITNEEAKKGIDKEISNCRQAKNSYNFCGNA